MNEEIKKVCEQIVALPEGGRFEEVWKDQANTQLRGFRVDDLKALRDYALRVEKMLEAAEKIEVGRVVLYRSQTVEGKWRANPGHHFTEVFDDALSAFEATQDEGREG